ncbi:MAG: SDR family NAD(P)-dependent oxidoreductase [Pigmentiphaga sp.]|uniref:SDR family NAD(P)-dependent oxidoreductase n=1 Tax=Pigmentiphaga sp. TaxID=1977564 RepID=UPI0029AC8A2F|nr:SDR family NAD(P)-dependent oxidoreductase [Pigmentiphaga sp.]MDX3907336.1 SDR family NAD(P)-dependent oxidoreductase [Pigmentiphaga sp.]
MTILLPAPARRLGRPRLLIVGCGDTGMHVLERLAARKRVFALTSSPDRLPVLRTAGAIPILGNLDAPAQLDRLRGLAAHVLMLAPPPSHGDGDPRSRRLSALLRRPARGTRALPARPDHDALPSRYSAIVAKRRPASGGIGRPLTVVYASTTGVYGDAQGRRLAESAPVRPASARGKRRVAAERTWRTVAPARARRARLGLAPWRVTVLRIPGIYGPQRLPLERLKNGLPRLAPDDDVYTNHIEISDLARALEAALYRGRPQRVVHAADGQDLKMGDYFDAVADAAGLPRPPRLPAAQVRAAVTPAMWSFMQESRRLDNRRLRTELRVRLRYPSVQHALGYYPPTR